MGNMLKHVWMNLSINSIFADFGNKGSAMDELSPRAYSNPQDLEKMRLLLIEGRRANNGTYYVHVGDLSWISLRIFDG
jgi:hypothetical protein